MMAMKVSDAAPPAKGQPQESAPAGQVVLSVEQFDRLVELLTPGYELSKLYLDQHRTQFTEPQDGTTEGVGQPAESVSVPGPNRDGLE